MNARRLLDTMELVAYELAEAEAYERKAAYHRKEAMKLQGAVSAEFRAALKETLEKQGLKTLQPTQTLV